MTDGPQPLPPFFRWSTGRPLRAGLRYISPPDRNPFPRFHLFRKARR